MKRRCKDIFDCRVFSAKEFMLADLLAKQSTSGLPQQHLPERWQATEFERSFIYPSMGSTQQLYGLIAQRLSTIKMEPRRPACTVLVIDWLKHEPDEANERFTSKPPQQHLGAPSSWGCWCFWHGGCSGGGGLVMVVDCGWWSSQRPAVASCS